MRINEGGNLPIYTFQVTDLLHDWGRPLTLTGPTYPRETTIIYYMMLYWGLLPRLTTKVVPQGIDTIYTSHKGVTYIPNGGATTYNDNIHQNIFRSYK